MARSSYPKSKECSDPGIQETLMSPILAGGFFTTSVIWEAQLYNRKDDLHSVIPIRAFFPGGASGKEPT